MRVFGDSGTLATVDSVVREQCKKEFEKLTWQPLVYCIRVVLNRVTSSVGFRLDLEQHKKHEQQQHKRGPVAEPNRAGAQNPGPSDWLI